MKVANNIHPQVIASAVGMLSPFIPELTPINLIDALKSYDSGRVNDIMRTPVYTRPLTKKEAATELNVSLMTIERYLRNGTLGKVKIGPRLVRISYESMNQLCAGE